MNAQSNVDFKKDFVDINNDISHIDTRLDIINNNIILLQNNIDNITNILLNSSIPQQDKGKYYQLQSEVMKTLALYNDNYQRLLDLKFKYRSQSNDFKLRTLKFIEIELKRQEEETDGMSYNKMLSVLSKLADNINDTTPAEQNPAFNLSFSKDEEL